MRSHPNEHRKVFPVPPVVTFRRCKNPKDIWSGLGSGTVIGDKGANIIRDVLVVVKLIASV